jgi:hypothetical protein
MILVAGGDADPNLAHLLRHLSVKGAPHRALLVGASALPRLTWRLGDGTLWIDGTEVRPTALFLRHDVFTHLRDRRPESHRRAARWYQVLLSWALAHEDIAFLNRRYGARHASKPHILILARRIGLAIPDTLVTSELETVDGLAATEWIAKPVNGGEYTRDLASTRAEEGWRLRLAAEPTIIQRRLVGPELRIYRVGERWLAFMLRSEALDYRATSAVEIEAASAPHDLTLALGRLMDRLDLDFGAADFKTCPRTGAWLFLEVNSAPMFAGFDRAACGALADAILDWLAAPRRGWIGDLDPGAIERGGVTSPCSRTAS